MAGRYVRPSYQYFDNSGRVLDSGQLFFYDSGTLTLKDVYSDPDGLVAIDNPVVLDGSGRTPDVYLEGSYKLIIKDKNNVQIEERDPVLAADDTTKGFAVWNAVTTYSELDIVRASNDLLYISIANSNQNNEPSASAAQWTQVQLLGSYNANQTYSIGDVVIDSIGDIYRSLTNSNTGNTPSSSPTDWTTVVAGAFSGNVTVGGTLGVTGQTTLQAQIDIGGNATGAAAGRGQMGAGTTNGLQLIGQGTTYDAHLANRNGAIAFAVNANSQDATALGDIVIGTSGKGIDFSAAGGGIFDFYEEGTWTPSVAFGGASVGVTYTNQYGFYTCTGDLCWVTCLATLTNKGSSTGTAAVTGLPFTSVGSAGCESLGVFYPLVISTADTPLVQVGTSQSQAFLIEVSNAGIGANVTDADFANNSSPRFTISYKVA